MVTVNDLADLRAGIDECDAQLVALLAKRNGITEKIGAIKQQIGAPLHAPDREADLLAARRQEAIAQGVNPELVEDILRRMMREAYQNQQGSLACVALSYQLLLWVVKAQWVSSLHNSLLVQVMKCVF